MDGLADDSPFSTVIVVADWIDRMRESYWPIALPFVIILLHMTCPQLDRTLFFTCAAWNLRSSLLSICYNLARSKYTLGISTFAFTIWAGYNFLWTTPRTSSPSHQDLPTIYLIPCRVSHKRKTPKIHAFSYSYLTVGIPVGYRGCVNGLISVDESDLPTSWLSGIWRLRSWFRVDSSDYLERGSNRLGLRGKLDNYLISQVCQKREYYEPMKADRYRARTRPTIRLLFSSPRQNS